MESIKTYRSGIGVLLMALPLLLWGCKKDGASGPNEPDPTNKALTVDVSGPSMAEVSADVTYNLSAGDQDGLAGVGMIEITAPDGSVETMDWSYSGNSADTSITRNFTEKGSGTIRVTAFGKNPVTGGRETKTAEKTTQYAAALEDRAIEITANNAARQTPIHGQTAELYKNQELLDTQTFTDGLARLEFQEEADASQTYEVRILAEGYTDQTQDVVSDETLEELAINLQPAAINIGQIPEMHPRGELLLDVTSIYSSTDPETGNTVPLEQAVLTSTDNRLVIQDQGNITYNISFADGADPAGANIPVSIAVSSQTNDAEFSREIPVQAQPEFSATVVNHVTEQPVSKLYAVQEDVNKIAIDSSVVNGGVVNIELLPNTESVRFGELRNERPYATEHRIFPENGGNYIIPVGSRDKYDKFKNLIGTFTEDEMKRRWADSEIICGYSTLSGLDFDSDLSYLLRDELCGWVQENWSLPEKIVIGKFVNTDYYNFSAGEWQTRQDSMSNLTLDIALDNFENEYSISLPGLPTPIVVDTLHYDFRNQEENALYIVPRSRPDDSRGTVEFWGTNGNDTGAIKHVLITLRSNSGDDGNAESQNSIFDQEAGAALYEQGRGQAQNLGNYESIVKEGHPNNNAEIFPLNLWMGWMNTSNLYKDAPNKNTFTNASIIPKEWNPDYSTLTTACDVIFGQECSDEGY